MMALLSSWREDLAAPQMSEDSEDHLRKEVYLRLREWLESALDTTPWHEKGLALAMALSTLSKETHWRLATARDRQALWEGLAHAILEVPMGEPLSALEEAARTHLAPKAALPSWFSTSLGPSAQCGTCPSQFPLHLTGG